MIIDSHSHYIPPEIAQHTTFYKVHWSNIERQIEVMDSLGIDKALLLYPTTDAHIQMGGWTRVCQIYNQELADVIHNYPNRFIGGGILPIDEPKAFNIELKSIKKLNLKVISLASSYDGVYLDDERFYPIYEFAQEYAMPIHIHSQIMSPIGEERVRDPLLTPVLEYVFDVSMSIGKMIMNETFLRFPDVKFIIAHYGGVIPFIKERFDNTYQMLRGRNLVKDIKKIPSDYLKNLYFDTSGSRSLASLLCTLEVVQADHILFGSDFPANQNIPAAIAVIAESQLSSEQKEAILANSLLRL